MGALHIIEWLRDDDRLRTGQDLFNELEPLGIMYNPPFDVRFYPVNTRSEFLTAIDRVQGEAQRTNRVPLLQIETHGSLNGIGPGGDNGLEWQPLRERLIALNEITRLNLFLGMAACEGAWAIKMLLPTTRAAFFGLLGPNDTIDPVTLSKGFTAFYKTMFRERSVDRGFEAMKAAVLPQKRVFSLISAQMAFEMVLAQYRDLQPTDADIEARLDAIEVQAEAHLLPEAERRAKRELARQFLCDTGEHFDRVRRDYFFIDRFPEHEHRFPLTLEGCRSVRVFAGGAESDPLGSA